MIQNIRLPLLVASAVRLFYGDKTVALVEPSRIGVLLERPELYFVHLFLSAVKQHAAYTPGLELGEDIELLDFIFAIRDNSDEPLIRDGAEYRAVGEKLRAPVNLVFFRGMNIRQPGEPLRKRETTQHCGVSHMFGLKPDNVGLLHPAAHGG
ncbi:hypothetical protein FHT76_004131 [Rhizobium sp. BK176]|nr:hypothetical protein [Rhizobium sp. BK399]MCS3740701.1 hypothetical protein [Rhizobium sp. BK661]MCS4092464.1 hypothetical protein [Rhizobium sp. BK176]